MDKNIVVGKKNWLIPTAHFLGWLLFFSIPFFFQDERNKLPPPPFGAHDMPAKENMFYLSLITNIFLVIIFYINISLISNVFTKGKKKTKYVLIQLLVIVLYYLLVKAATYILLPDGGMFLPFAMPIFNYVIVVLVALCYSLVSENMRVDRIQKEKENETLRTELTFLRWQISPHFLFNVLNNMVSLARSRSEKLEDMLINLSNLMRYMLYETDEQKVFIERETEYLKSYISLQKLRFGNEVKINSDIYVSEKTNNKDVIEPMLLIPFIENAFKHGIGAVTNPEIEIYVHYENDMMTMNIKNKYQPEQAEKTGETKGIGLANVKRRLNLLYPNKYSLSINNSNGWYIITLGINLS